MRRVLCPITVGRDDELRALGEAVEAAASGAGSVHFLVGEAGVRKSRLATACAEAARSRGMPA
jgi:predicted ATPase